jgi:hypothetical protein
MTKEDLELKLDAYIRQRYKKGISQWMLNEDRYIIYSNLVDAFMNIYDCITIDRPLAREYALLIIKYAERFKVEIKHKQEYDTAITLKLSGLKEDLEALDNFCQTKFKIS